MRGDQGMRERAKTPGPGNYEYKQFIGKEAPKITMSAKYGADKSESRYVPGPGNYNQTSTNVYRPKVN